MKDPIFIGFCLFTIACGLGVVFARNAVYSAFSLILSFFGLSAVYILWDATFIAMIQILVYTGAIVVLFVFVVMLLDLGWSTSGSHSQSWFHVSLSGVGVWLFSLLMLRVLNSAGGMERPGDAPGFDLRTISKLLFNEYLWPFEVLSVFMLALIIAVYALTRPDSTEKTV